MISPDLSAGLGIGASSLGLLTSAYFLAFAAMQIPAGMLLDRYGPRRVEPVLLAVAGCGALGFAASDSLAGLAISRALIGAGVSVCLMAPLKAIATWYPRERQASLSGWMMVAGGSGALLATAPLAAVLTVMSWRGVFVALVDRDLRRRGADLPARARRAASGDTPRARARSGTACAACSAIRASGGSRRSPRPAWDRSWRSRGCGRCRG